MKDLKFLSAVLLVCASVCAFAQETSKQDTLSKFDKFNKKAEKFFKYAPAPIITYSTEAGNTFGLAKFNVFRPVKKDTISRPSKLAEVVTFSTKGRINVSISNDLILKEDKYIFLTYFNYKKTPEYIFGIGNDVSVDDAELVTIDRAKFSVTALRKIAKHYYGGISFDVADYFGVETDSNSFIRQENLPGLNGGTDVGLGISGALDSRDNRYNPYKGAFLLTTLIYYPSRYEFASFYIDGRKYFNYFKKHVIAVQATATYTTGTVPFYDLAQMGGEERMRGYYKGALRDKVLVDAQVEYRMPVWNIFGLTTWVATGRVADKFSNLSFNGFWLSFGGGIRIRVDSDNNTNLRFDMGFGPNGVSGFYFNFAEAF